MTGREEEEKMGEGAKGAQRCNKSMEDRTYSERVGERERNAQLKKWPGSSGSYQKKSEETETQTHPRTKKV